MTQPWLPPALHDPTVITRYHHLIHPTPTSTGCLVWLGALSAQGSGRFWVEQGHVIIAHRFGYALTHGTTTQLQIAHTCDEAWCQNPAHWEQATPAQNTNDWIRRRDHLGNPLRDTRGALGRAKAIRTAARTGTDINAALHAGLPELDLYQTHLPGLD